MCINVLHVFKEEGSNAINIFLQLMVCLQVRIQNPKAYVSSLYNTFKIV